MLLESDVRTMDLSIIIINWHSSDFVRECLKSLWAGSTPCNFEVIVVDNASSDGCGQMLEVEFPRTKFIASVTNLGFARANNLGAREAAGRNLLFLNPDTEVVGDALPHMVAFLDGRPDAGTVGCRLLNTDRSLQTSCVQAFPSILNQAIDSEYLRQRFPGSGLWGTSALLSKSGPSDVEVISGACLMIKANVFNTVGQFTPDYFMYAEDADLCFKVRQAGCKNYYLPDASVVHHGGRSSDKSTESNFAAVMMRESLMKFMQLHRGPVYAAVYQGTIAIAAAIRIVLLGVGCLYTWGEARREALYKSLRKWIKLLRWGLGMERWTRQEA